ncbi:hypothetical protein SAMN04488570_1362 [Nocardioides scoriae]|uniref:Uncharacterized protein n=1 Tax=Nocardioides scoriae TaxID=642780 RepID=A0A1H1QAT7_9ACTN|nr:hypothetical protein SAMN04488570_1362 [Nocardioides scoriae]
MHTLLDLELAHSADHDRSIVSLSPLRQTLSRLLGRTAR